MSARTVASNTSDWADEYRQQIDDCEKRESRLSDWERMFLDSLGRQLDAGKPPSLKQIECLDRAWERVTDRG